VFQPIARENLRAAVAYLLRRFRTVTAEAGVPEATPIHITETGWPTDAQRTESAQADVLAAVAGAVIASDAGVRACEWFGLRDGLTTAAWSARFGILRDDYTPKPAFTASSTSSPANPREPEPGGQTRCHAASPAVHSGPVTSGLGLIQVDQRDPDIGAHHFTQLGGSLGDHDLQRREHPPLRQVATARGPVGQPLVPCELRQGADRLIARVAHHHVRDDVGVLNTLRLHR
jgi:hypothetical protein